MTITDMDLPDEAVDAAIEAYDAFDGPAGGSMDAAIRAALQALLDTGRAIYFESKYPAERWLSGRLIIIDLSADERMPALQEEQGK